jgi:hypothetical protein
LLIFVGLLLCLSLLHLGGNLNGQRNEFLQTLLGLFVDWLYDLDIHVSHMKAVVLKDNSVLHFPILVQTEDRLPDVPCCEFVEAFEAQGGSLTPYLGGNGRAGITNKVLHVEYLRS